MPVIPKDCSSYCSSNTYLFLSVSFLPLTAVRGDKEELLYSTVRTIPTTDTLGCFHEFSVAWEVDVGIYSPKVFILLNWSFKTYCAFSITMSWFFFLKALSNILCIYLAGCHR